MECSSAAAGAQQINSSCTEINVRSKASIHNKPTAGTSISFAMNTRTNKIIGSPSQNIIGFDSTYTNQLWIKDEDFIQKTVEAFQPLSSIKKSVATPNLFPTTDSLRSADSSGCRS